MLSKNYILVLSAFVTGSVMLTTSCKKGDDISTLSPVAVGDNQVPSAITESFTIVANDGHTIGINGKKNETIARQSNDVANGCGSASLLIVNAISNVALSGNRVGCVLSNSWTSGGGACIALYINGQPYKDGNSGYGLWSATTNAIAAEYTQIAGGITSGSIFNDFIRTYCNADTTGSSYFDSPITTYIVPDGFTCGIVNPKHGGHH